MAQDQHVRLITQILKRTELIYPNIITIISKITRLSKTVSLSFSIQSEFIEEIIRGITMKDNRLAGEVINPQVVKQGLEILLNICVAHPNPQFFIDSHNLKPLFVQLEKTAKAKNLVIIEDIVGNLLARYDSKNQSNRNIPQ